MADNDKVQFQNLKNKQSSKAKEVVNTSITAPKNDEKKSEKNVEQKIEQTPEKPTVQKSKPKEKKSEAVVNGINLPISLKHSKYIGNFIKFFVIDDAISNLEKVSKKKLAVPMKGEIAHRKGKRLNGKGMMSGRYPVNASKYFIKLLKTLKANSIANGLEIEKTIISEVIVNKGPDQMHRFGRTKFKRTHVCIKSKERKSKK